LGGGCIVLPQHGDTSTRLPALRHPSPLPSASPEAAPVTQRHASTHWSHLGPPATSNAGRRQHETAEASSRPAAWPTFVPRYRGAVARCSVLRTVVAGGRHLKDLGASAAS
jgi:hypothetical protein